MSEGSYTDELESRLTPDEIERARIRLYGEFPPEDMREVHFIEQRKILMRQIEQAFRIPASFLSVDITRLAAISQEGRIEASIKLKVIGQ